jgi:hypothetical protein
MPDPVDVSAAAQLRQAEDEWLGKDVERVNGQIERGHGSLYQKLTPQQKAYLAALEEQIKVEDLCATARSALAVAEEKTATAKKKVEAAAATIVKSKPDAAA